MLSPTLDSQLPSLRFSDIETRRHLHTKYCCTVDMLDGVRADIVGTSIGVHIGDGAMLAVGVGNIPSLMLKGMMMLAGLFNEETKNQAPELPLQSPH